MAIALTVETTTALNLPHHPDLMAATSTDGEWLLHFTPAGQPADYVIEWREGVLDADGEISNEPRFVYGVFSTLQATLEAVLTDPTRSPDSVVDLDINAWSLHYGRHQ
jgi:hypothetical protein